MHKSQIFFYLLISFLSGIFVASVFSARGGSASGGEVGQVFIYIGFIVAIGFIAVFGYQKSFNQKGLLAGFLLVAFLFGIARFNSANLKQDALDVFVGLEAGGKGVEVVVNGYVDDELIIKENKVEVVLRAKEIVTGGRVIKINDKILATIPGFPLFTYGDAVTVRGSLQKPENFGEFDYVAYLKTKDIRSIMFYPTIESGEWNVEGGNSGFFEKTKISLYRKIFAVKNRFQESINSSIPEPGASYISAILLGNRQNVPDNIRENFNRTSTSHILAISGMHVSIIAASLLSLLVYFFRRRTAFWISVCLIVFFAILTGGSSSVIRASVMGLIVLFAAGYGRLYNARNSITLAGAAMVYFNPLVLRFNVGFQLSFLAVLGLIYFAPILKEGLFKMPEVFGIKEVGIMTISAQLFVLPLLLNQFNVFSTVSLPANILVLPFVPAAMLFGWSRRTTFCPARPAFRLFCLGGYVLSVESYRTLCFNEFFFLRRLYSLADDGGCLRTLVCLDSEIGKTN